MICVTAKNEKMNYPAPPKRNMVAELRSSHGGRGGGGREGGREGRGCRCIFRNEISLRVSQRV